MLIEETAVDHRSAPRDYEECFRIYRDYIVALVKKHGIDDSRAEDVTHDILMRFYERDFLAQFDPTLTFHYHGKEHAARFKSFLTKFVLTYLKGHRDKQHRLAAREALIMDAPSVVPTGEPGHNVTTWGEQHGDTHPSAEEELLGGAFGVEQIRCALVERVKNTAPRSQFDTCDLVALFDEVMFQIDTTGGWDVNDLRIIFGISSTAMHSWMWWLRENCAEALECRLPPKRSHRR